MNDPHVSRGHVLIMMMMMMLHNLYYTSFFSNKYFACQWCNIEDHLAMILRTTSIFWRFLTVKMAFAVGARTSKYGGHGMDALESLTN